MANKLMIVMVNTDPKNSAELGAPFFQATAGAGELAKRGVAEKLFVKNCTSKSVYDFIKDAHEAGVKFKVCTPTLGLWGEDLIPEIEETVGGSYVIQQAMDDNTVTFTY